MDNIKIYELIANTGIAGLLVLYFGWELRGLRSEMRRLHDAIIRMLTEKKP